ncbi:exodeoxyribonuclease VII large subunit [Ruminococcus sp. HUN007]|uniref:exodeoxyribonuclease VII large subunit n=1 Tax=Ruminococcus sp. HUN007 TaxID=1514668 RepID=UPI0005D21734|nr:exodeoxyribonuclease VII large subunit [Ruminococcus sp. HUN007]
MNILTVSQLNRYLAFKLKEDDKLKGIFLKGEISNFKNAGHLYFTLKDSETLIKAVMFRSHAASLRFMPENGQSVIAMGSVSVFERDGIYQLYVTDMVPDGAGKLQMEFEKLKKELEAEGLFDKEHKKQLPEYPKRVGVVTSEKGAALQDMINIMSRRYPLAELVIYPSLVQGADAPASLCRSLSMADCGDCDVIIIGRGGGSYEDLAAFNDRQLAYYIYHLNTPVISAVGHETDFTIADFVADMRAPTPSAAAELAVPDISDMRKYVDSLRDRTEKAFDFSTARLETRLASLMTRLGKMSPENILLKNISELEMKRKRLEYSMKNILTGRENALAGKIARLETLNPLEVLKRGYTTVYRKDGEMIKSVSEITAGDSIRIDFADGSACASVTDTERKKDVF